MDGNLSMKCFTISQFYFLGEDKEIHTSRNFDKKHRFLI